jgi:hypothetical protein
MESSVRGAGHRHRGSGKSINWFSKCHGGLTKITQSWVHILVVLFLVHLVPSTTKCFARMPQAATPTEANPNQPDHPVKAKPGASWKDNEQHVLPKNRLGIVFFGLCCCIFLAAIDQVSSIHWLRLVDRIDLFLQPDHRCNGFAHNYRGFGRGREL